MTNPVLDLTVGSLLQDVQKGLADIETALALIDKFTVFLPAQYRLPLQELQKILKTVSDVIAKL